MFKEQKMKAKVQFLSAMIIFGTIGVFVKYIDLSSSEVAFLRSFIGSLFLILVMIIWKKHISWSNLKGNAVLLLFSSIALSLNWIFLFQAFKHTTLSNATLSYYFAPVFVLILTPFVLKEKLSSIRVICIGIAMLGMLMIVGNGSLSTSGENLLGIGYGITAALFYASFILLNKFIRKIGELEITIIQLGIAAIIMMPYIYLTEGFRVLQISNKSILFILTIGIIHTGVAYLLFFSGVRKLKGQSIAILSYVDPMTSLTISAFILLEPMTIMQIIGGILLLGSTFVSEIDSILFPKRRLKTKL
jgi:RarD protein